MHECGWYFCYFYKENIFDKNLLTHCILCIVVQYI